MKIQLFGIIKKSMLDQKICQPSCTKYEISCAADSI
jgi:hypothetical protein